MSDWVAMTLAMSMTAFVVLSLRERGDQLLRRLEGQALADPLTGLSNRRSFDEELDRAGEWAARTGRPLALVTVDLDHFKGINDTYGHAVGDQALQAVATAMRSVGEQDDVMARLGGDEFVMLLRADLRGALRTTEALREAVAAVTSLPCGAPAPEHRRGRPARPRGHRRRAGQGLRRGAVRGQEPGPGPGGGRREPAAARHPPERGPAPAGRPAGTPADHRAGPPGRRRRRSRAPGTPCVRPASHRRSRAPPDLGVRPADSAEPGGVGPGCAAGGVAGRAGGDRACAAGGWPDGRPAPASTCDDADGRQAGCCRGSRWAPRPGPVPRTGPRISRRSRGYGPQPSRSTWM